MFGSKPPTHIDQLLFVYLRPVSQLVFTLILQVTFEVVEKTHLLLEFIGIILELVLFDNVLPLNSFNIEETILAACEHLGGIVEVDPNHIIAQGIPYSIL